MFRDVSSIRLKVMLIVLVTSLAALLFASVVLVAYDVRTHRESWARDLTIQAEVVGRTSAPALVFLDTLTAHQSLAALAIRPEVQAAAVYTADGHLFATYAKSNKPRDFPTQVGANGHRFDLNRFTLFREIDDTDGRVGTVYLAAQYDLNDRLANYLPVLAIIVLGSLAVALGMSYALQSSLTRPILAIADVAQQVRARRDFSLRVARDTNDETGQLVDAFNAMMAEVAEAQASLLDSNRRKDEFLATLAHELRSPLGPIRNAAYALRLEGEEESRGLEIIDRQVRHMARLIEDLMDLSRISRDVLELRYSDFPVRDLMPDILEGARYEAEEAGHTLEVEIENPDLPLCADRARIVQVIGNLLNNAIKYTPRGGTITIRVASQDAKLTVEVEDDGIGIPPDKLEQIFEPFSQLDRSLEKTRGGLGLGLALAQRLVALHGGTLTACSEGLGKGSTFRVTLPIVSEEGTEPAPALSPAREVASAKLRILVADDSVDGAESLARLLIVLGHDADVAFDGQQALDLMGEHSYDAAILDIGMPHVNGYEVARRVRESELDHRMLLVALTGWGQESDKQRALDAGFDRHLTKPVAPEQLVEALRPAVLGAGGVTALPPA
jgi:signal transduction histidine kinase/ActR/RegA family two-component response regulator